MKILDLKPAQFAVGLLEVEHKMKDYAHMSKDEFHAYTEKHPVPVALDSLGEHYIIDHHHLCAAYLFLGHENVHVEIKHDFSQLDQEAFWDVMKKANLTYLYDQFGGKREWYQLPINIRGMADDPYRSLVWKLKDLKIWTKEEVAMPFLEFKLAEFLRPKVKIGNTKESFNLAVEWSVRNLPKFKIEMGQYPGLKF
jgi:hypothetical protein